MAWRFRWLPVVLATVLVHPLLGSTPVTTEPPSESELAVLRLLSQNELTVDALAPLLKLALSEPGGDYRMGYVLGTAVRESAIPMTLVQRSMADSGCRSAPEGPDVRCRRFQESVSAAIGYRARSTDLSRDRARLLKFAREQPGGNHDLEAAYARALIDSRQLTTLDILESYLSADPRAKGLVDEDVAAAFGVDPSSAGRRWRSALATALAQILRESRGDPEVVKQVRNLPEEALTHARELESPDSRSLLSRSTLCTIDKWRAGDAAPDKWTAWSQLLVCRGW
jgi:hypothetical protein